MILKNTFIKLITRNKVGSQSKNKLSFFHDFLLKMKLPAASSGVSKSQPHKTNLAASCGELTPKEIRVYQSVPNSVIKKQRGQIAYAVSEARPRAL